MSNPAFFTTLSCLFAATSLAFAGDSATPKSFNDVADFVDSHLIGRTLEANVTSRINDGTIETEFQSRSMYANLVRTQDTAAFDRIVLIRQRLWQLDSSGVRTKDEPRIKNRALVIRYAIRASKATGDAIGMSSILTNTIAPTSGQGSGIQMRVTDGRLILVDSTPVYFDGFAKGDKYKPTASIDTTTFTVTEDKLSAETVEIGYDVDPKTLERTRNGHEVRLKGAEIPSLF